MIDFSQFKLYAIQDSEGRLFRPASRTPYNKSQWTDNVLEAHFYGKIAPARAKISEIANRTGGEYIPILLEVSLGRVRALDETGRINKAQINYIKAEIKAKKRSIEYNENCIRNVGIPTYTTKERCLESIEHSQRHIKRLEEKLECLIRSATE